MWLTDSKGKRRNVEWTVTRSLRNYGVKQDLGPLPLPKQPPLQQYL